MLVDGGIEFENFEKTIDIVKTKLKRCKSNFTMDDIDISKKSIKSSAESIKDSISLFQSISLVKSCLMIIVL